MTIYPDYDLPVIRAPRGGITYTSTSTDYTLTRTPDGWTERPVTAVKNHRPECRSWLPTEPPCACTPTLAPPVLIIIAPTYQEGRYHLTHTLGLSDAHHQIIWHRDGLEYLRGLRWPLRDGYRLEIIGYPDDILQGTYIRTALREMGVPDPEIYEMDHDSLPDPMELTLP